MLHLYSCQLKMNVQNDPGRNESMSVLHQCSVTFSPIPLQRDHIHVMTFIIIIFHYIVDASRGANEAWVSRQALQDVYQKLLVMDLEYALDKKVEQDLYVSVRLGSNRTCTYNNNNKSI